MAKRRRQRAERAGRGEEGAPPDRDRGSPQSADQPREQVRFRLNHIASPTSAVWWPAGAACSRVQALLGPRLARPRPPEGDALVQAEGTVVPELHLDGRDAEARPIRRSRDVADRVSGGHDGDGLLEREAALRAGATAARPRRRAGCRGRAWRSRRRPRRRSRARRRRARAPGGAAISSGSTARPCVRPAAPRPWRSRGWCRTRSRARGDPPRRAPFSSTMRTLGRPAASTLASAMAFGIVGLVRLGLGEPGLEQRERLAGLGEIAGLWPRCSSRPSACLTCVARPIWPGRRVACAFTPL